MTVLGDALLAFIVTAISLPPIVVILRRWDVLDRPTSRSSHDRPTLRGGGIAIAIGALAAWAASDGLAGSSRVAVIVAAGGFGLIGLAEDIWGVSPSRRLIAQIAVALLALPWLLDGVDEGWLPVVAIGGVTALWIVAFANAFNFMDGINGIAAAQAIVAGGASAIIGGSEGVSPTEIGGVIILAAALAFIPANFPRAQLFLGDAGSYFVGAWLAVVAVLGLRAGLPVEAALAPLALCAIDTALTFLRRVRRGEHWFEPHREHTYQQLVAHGWSHTVTTMYVAGVISACSLLGAVSLADNLAARVCADAAIAILLVGYLFSPRWLARSHVEG